MASVSERSKDFFLLKKLCSRLKIAIKSNAIPFTSAYAFLFFFYTLRKKVLYGLGSSGPDFRTNLISWQKQGCFGTTISTKCGVFAQVYALLFLSFKELPILKTIRTFQGKF